jgi:predicted permease
MRAMAARLAQAYPRTNWDTGSAIEPLHDAIVGDVRPALLVLMGAVGFVLLIVCVNVAGLVLAQSMGRARELAIRRTLGAGRGRLILGMLLESLLHGLAGGAGGLVLAVWLTRAFAASAEGLGIPLLDQARLDATVMAFTAGLAILAAALFGALPAWQAGSGRDLAGRMRADGPQVAGGRRRVRSLLIVTQTALAVVLLVGAGLLARSFAQLRSVDVGFDPAHTQTFSVKLPGTRYAKTGQRARFVETLLDRVRSRPGVESAGAVFGLPMTAFGYTISARQVDGRMLDDREADRLAVHLRAATPDYFRTMGIRLVAGRAFEPTDREGAPLAVVVSESAAELLWPNADPIGHSIELGTRLGQDERRAGGEVVGVVADVRHRGPGQPARATVYVAHAQSPTDFVSFVVRSSVDPSALLPLLRADLEAVDGDIPMFQVRTLKQISSDSVARPRLYMALLGIFAATAVLLASLGLYGVLAQTVGQRTREIGIRMAVGAERRQVILLVLRQGGRLALAGIALGLAAATLVSRTLRGLLVGVEPVDPPTYAAVGVALFAVALVASFIPARRAAHVDPVRALRTE